METWAVVNTSPMSREKALKHLEAQNTEREEHHCQQSWMDVFGCAMEVQAQFLRDAVQIRDLQAQAENLEAWIHSLEWEFGAAVIVGLGPPSGSETLARSDTKEEDPSVVGSPGGPSENRA